MIQKCSRINVLEVFFVEPTTIHFVREISRKIGLAPTSVKSHLNALLKQGLILEKESKPFNGYIANREDEKFLFNKKVYNLYTLYRLKQELIEKMHPQLVSVFGSYSLGEDVETSDIDVFVLSNVENELNLTDLEKKLQRKINIMVLDNLNKVEDNIRKKIMNGFVIYGGFGR